MARKIKGEEGYEGREEKLGLIRGNNWSNHIPFGEKTAPGRHLSAAC